MRWPLLLTCWLSWLRLHAVGALWRGLPVGSRTLRLLGDAGLDTVHGRRGTASAIETAKAEAIRLASHMGHGEGLVGRSGRWWGA